MHGSRALHDAQFDRRPQSLAVKPPAYCACRVPQLRGYTPTHSRRPPLGHHHGAVDVAYLRTRRRPSSRDQVFDVMALTWPVEAGSVPHSGRIKADPAGAATRMTEAPASTGFRQHVWLATISTCVPSAIASSYSLGKPSRGAHDGYPSIVGTAARGACYSSAAAGAAGYPSIASTAR
jgi:hypothetical protein